MATRRQERVSRIIKEGVCDAIANHLSDPRIKGFVSVTRVEMSPDLRTAEVYLSIFGGDEKVQRLTFTAIQHAQPRIQSIVAERVKSKFCTVLRFHMDEVFKKTLETFRLIDQAANQYEQNPLVGDDLSTDLADDMEQ